MPASSPLHQERRGEKATPVSPVSKSASVRMSASICSRWSRLIGAPRAGALAGWSDRRVHGCRKPFDVLVEGLHCLRAKPFPVGFVWFKLRRASPGFCSGVIVTAFAQSSSQSPNDYIQKWFPNRYATLAKRSEAALVGDPIQLPRLVFGRHRLSVRPLPAGHAKSVGRGWPGAAMMIQASSPIH